MKAVILAAGEGTRLQPLTQSRPKGMLPVGDKPLLEHIVESIKAAGVDEIVLVVGHKRERIQNYFENGDDWGVDIQYVVQPNPRGTGDALLEAEHEVGNSCIVINGDRIIGAELLSRIIDKHQSTGDACLAITEVEDPTQYGAVTLDGEEITDIQEKPEPHEVTSSLVNAGVYVFGPDIFAAIRQTDHYGELRLTDTLREYIQSQPLHAVRYDGMWLEISRPWDLLSVNSAMLARNGSTIASSAVVSEDATLGEPTVVGDHTRIQPGARVFHDVVIGDNVTIGANTVLTNTIILEDTVVKPGTVVADCVIGSGSQIGPLNSIEGGLTDVRVDDELYTEIKFGGLIGDNVTMKGNVTVEPGALIGNGVRVESGSALDGRIPNDTHVYRG
ncbi:NTP transferase domain-containing protein [Haloferax sp. MBLA0076]|uniref:Bifunctional protein GlmU n=1 Tax=Haloferax litoreum TaxID=2666140 RepID=A0A6A8GFW2_9EURY|nr:MULTISPECIES: sugar phosphate nucleotidyltransferase [Haloferax]KAB1193267.1 NTP transferase domain-containing protein [Haloferax sp. CBA1148]MRX21766.1 NTP transferase domain-containing protein [Haloferax litoreum]